MEKEKFVLIDSNIYLHFCFVDLEIDNADVLEKLIKLLNADKFKLLLPEVVELEFERRFNEKIELINKEADSLIEIIQKSNTIGSKKAKENLVKSIKQGKETTLKDIEKIRKDLAGIFKHSNTVRNDLILTPEILTEAYRIFLRGDKPYKRSTSEKKTYENIQPDCLIIASAAKYLKDKSNYEFYLSTGNFIDFTENPNMKSRDNLELANSIKKLFKNITYYFDPLKMLNENFAAKYTKQTIKKFEEERSKFPGILGVYNTSSSILVNPMDPLTKNPLATTMNVGSSVLGTNFGLTNPFQTNLVSGLTKTCMNCSKVYVYDPRSVVVDNGLCDICKGNGATSARLTI